jgi:hypothetical protein
VRCLDGLGEVSAHLNEHVRRARQIERESRPSVVLKAAQDEVVALRSTVTADPGTTPAAANSASSDGSV